MTMPQPESNSDNWYLVIDQGGHASRAVVLNGNGKSMAQAERSLETYYPQDGFVEHDPDQLVQSVLESLEDLSQQMGSRINNIACAGMVTQRSNIVCWNRRTADKLSPVLSWQDTRGRNQLVRLGHNTSRIHESTGLFPSAHYGATKLRWCLDNIPEVRNAAEKGELCFGPMSSYLVWRLTDLKPLVSDPVSSSRTLLWNLNTGDWDPWLLDLFGIPLDALPECVATRHEFGHIQVGGKRVPLTIVNGDQSASLFACGRLESGIAYINIGTGAFVSRFTDHSPLLAPRLLTSVIHREDSESLYVLEGTVNGAGSALQWAEKSLKIKGMWSRLPSWLNASEDSPVFLNGVSGLAAPFWIPEFRSEFVGEGGDQARITAVVESIVFLLSTNIMEMEKTVKSAEKVRITGGLSRLDGLCQRVANLTGLPIHRPSETEASVRGAGYLLAGMPDKWPETAPGIWFYPDQEGGIRSRFDRWQLLMNDRLSTRDSR
jgi:glycerol kinase